MADLTITAANVVDSDGSGIKPGIAGTFRTASATRIISAILSLFEDADVEIINAAIFSAGSGVCGF